MYWFSIKNIGVQFDNLQAPSLPFQKSICISSAENRNALFCFALVCGLYLPPLSFLLS